MKGTKCRVYDNAETARRLAPAGLNVADIWYADRDGKPVNDPPHRDGQDFDYVALLLTKP